MNAENQNRPDSGIFRFFLNFSKKIKFFETKKSFWSLHKEAMYVSMPDKLYWVGL